MHLVSLQQRFFSLRAEATTRRTVLRRGMRRRSRGGSERELGDRAQGGAGKTRHRERKEREDKRHGAIEERLLGERRGAHRWREPRHVEEQRQTVGGQIVRMEERCTGRIEVRREDDARAGGRGRGSGGREDADREQPAHYEEDTDAH